MLIAAVLTCASLYAVDGDTVKCDGQLLRPMGDGSPYVSGFDAPEIGHHADCPAEVHLGLLAAGRMSELLQDPGLAIEDSGVVDDFGRPLVVLRLSDGRTIGAVMISEGFAREWTPEYHADWCTAQ